MHTMLVLLLCRYRRDEISVLTSSVYEGKSRERDRLQPACKSSDNERTIIPTEQ